MYSLIRNFLEEILNDNWMGQNSKLAILGGIMLNFEGICTDMFLPLMFEVRGTYGKTYS